MDKTSGMEYVMKLISKIKSKLANRASRQRTKTVNAICVVPEYESLESTVTLPH
jgi:hypothetical protein